MKEITTSVVIGTDCNGCKSHYHTITASKVLTFQVKNYFLQNTSIIQRLAAGQWFSPVSSINKTDCHEIAEILLKVALNTIKPLKPLFRESIYIKLYY
jgi:hypothetical protein